MRIVKYIVRQGGLTEQYKEKDLALSNAKSRATETNQAVSVTAVIDDG